MARYPIEFFTDCCYTEGFCSRTKKNLVLVMEESDYFFTLCRSSEQGVRGKIGNSRVHDGNGLIKSSPYLGLFRFGHT